MTLDDMASDQEERFRNAALAAQRNKAQKQRLKPCGYCYSCTGELPPNELFCDGGCRDDYERQESARIRNGG